MKQQAILKWFQLFLKRENELQLNPLDWTLLVSEILNEAQIFLVDKSQGTADFFQRQQITSIIEILQKVVKIIYLGDENSLIDLFNFIYLILKDVPELEGIIHKLNDKEQIEIMNNLNVKEDQCFQFDFSKYELLQMIEHIEAKYQALKEREQSQNSLIKQQQENFKNELNQKEEQLVLLNKQIEILNQEIENLTKFNVSNQIVENLQIQLHQNICEKSQLIQYMQRQQSVISEQEIQLDQFKRKFSLKNEIRQSQDTDQFQLIFNLENKVSIYSDKIKELNQIVQTQRTEIAKLEIAKNLAQQQLDEFSQQKNNEILQIQQELEIIKQQQQKAYSDITIRSKLLSIHSHSSKNVLAQELIELEEKTYLRNRTSMYVNEGDEQKQDKENIFYQQRAMYHEIIENLLLDLEREKKNNEILTKQITELKTNSCQSFKTLYKQSQEIGPVNSKLKKIEQQNDLLRKIIDIFLFNGSVNQ